MRPEIDLLSMKLGPLLPHLEWLYKSSWNTAEVHPKLVLGTIYIEVKLNLWIGEGSLMFMCLLPKSQLKSREKENYLRWFEWIPPIPSDMTGLVHRLRGERRAEFVWDCG